MAALTRMPFLELRKARISYPTGKKDFQVLQAFPSTFSTQEIDPFLMCDEFGPLPSKGKIENPDKFVVDWHPHRGQDLLTYLKKGIGRHGDSLGNRETFPAPGIQWISAGSGIEHAEAGGTPLGQVEHGFQIWVNVPADRKMDDPRYGTGEKIPIITAPGAQVSVLAGSVSGNDGPFKTVQNVQILDVEIEANYGYDHNVPVELDNCIIYLYSGSATIGGHEAGSGSTIKMDASQPNARQIQFRAGPQGMGALVFAGKRLNEPIAWRGPFVMNTEEEIATAFDEYRKGTFLRKRAPWNYKKWDSFPQKPSDL